MTTGPRSVDELLTGPLLDHYRNPRGQAQVAQPDIAAEEANPFCGDVVRLRLKLDGRRVVAASFQGEGCSLCRVSASMLVDVAPGKTLAELAELGDAFRRVMEGEGPSAGPTVRLGELEALRAVRHFPVRVKCVLLAWVALEAGLEEYRRGAGDP